MLPISAILLPILDPVAIQVGPLAIRWYALAYIAGILLGWKYLQLLNKKSGVISQKAMEDIIVWIVLGIMLGGRLGYILFYNLPHYLNNPGEMLAVWKGGMSFHGGMIGVIAAIYLMCRKHNLSFLSVMDMIAVVTPIGFFLGRIANFINGELYGRMSDMPWAVIFPGHDIARHPSQLYEAGLEGLVLLAILSAAWSCTSLRHKPGAISGLFLIGYGVLRSIAELFREPDTHIGFLAGGITMGQLLCIPMIMLGAFLLVRRAHT